LAARTNGPVGCVRLLTGLCALFLTILEKHLLQKNKKYTKAVAPFFAFYAFFAASSGFGSARFAIRLWEPCNFRVFAVSSHLS
jgi:hypothetical protein